MTHQPHPSHQTDLLLAHPLAQRFHLEHDPDYPALLASVQEIGILEPLKVCRTDGKGDSPGYFYVVDGLRRWRAAREAMLSEVPIMEVNSSDAATIILHSLIARRHLTKSGIAYVSIPILKPVLDETRQRDRDCQFKPKSTQVPEKCGSARNALPQTTDQIAERLGIGRRLLMMAQEIHKKFSEHPDLREIWEPKILSGEMALGLVQQAIAGKIAAIDGQTTPKGDAAQLLFEFLDLAEHRLDPARWAKLDTVQRAQAISKFQETFLPSLPAEFHLAWAKYYRDLKSAK